MEGMIVKKERCKQCGLCVANCPNDAISFSCEFNDAGYCFAIVDDEKCIRCGICYTMCPDGVYEIIGQEKAAGGR
ncbi:MAG: DUF362 domain-containing protein [Desulfovibrio sp.]